MIEPAIQKTSMLMALTCLDATHQQVSPMLLQAYKDAKVTNRQKMVEQWTQRCFDYCRESGNFALSSPCQKSIGGFCGRFVSSWIEIHAKTNLPFEPTALHMALILEEAVNCLLHDLWAHNVCPDVRGVACWKWLKHHHTQLCDSYWELLPVTESEREFYQIVATELYCSMSDYLKPENHKLVWR